MGEIEDKEIDRYQRHGMAVLDLYAWKDTQVDLKPLIEIGQPAYFWVKHPHPSRPVVVIARDINPNNVPKKATKLEKPLEALLCDYGSVRPVYATNEQ